MNDLGRALIWAGGVAALAFGTRGSGGSGGGLSAYDPDYVYEAGFEEALAELGRSVHAGGTANTPWKRLAARKQLQEALSDLATIISDIRDPARRDAHLDALPPPILPIIRKALKNTHGLSGL